MSEDDLIAFRNSLDERLASIGILFADLQVEELPPSDIVQVSARCLSDPLLVEPASLKDREDSSPDTPDNHRQIFISVVFCESDETAMPVLSTTLTYIVDREHANYFPLPKLCEEEGCVRVEINWEFDRETLNPGIAEMKEEGRMHYLSVLPPRHVVAFVEACAVEAEYWI